MAQRENELSKLNGNGLGNSESNQIPRFQIKYNLILFASLITISAISKDKKNLQGDIKTLIEI